MYPESQKKFTWSRLELKLILSQSVTNFLFDWFQSEHASIFKNSFHFKFQGLVKDADTLQGIANALIHVRNITRIAKSFRRSDDINHDITSVHDGNYKQNADIIFIAYL